MHGETDRRTSLTIVLGLMVVVPFVWLIIEFFQPFESGTMDIPIGNAPPDVFLSAYIGFLLFLFSAVLWRNETIARRDKFAWTFFLILFFPLAHLALIYRVYWHEPVRMASSLPEQVKILKDLRAQRMKDQSG